MLEWESVRERERERERDGDRGRRKGNILRGTKAMTMLKKSHNNKLKTRWTLKSVSEGV